MRDDNRNIFVTTCKKGRKLVILPKILFSGKRSIPWDKVESYLKQYIGIFVEIDETKDIIHIGRDFVDEFTGSIYTRNLKGNLAKAKANMAQGIPELIECAREKRWNIDFGKKHKKKAEKGWYRYNVRFAMPVTNESGEICRYNFYKAVLLVRWASDNKLYLYDIQNLKKETSNPL